VKNKTIVCPCFEITEQDIRKVLSSNKDITFEQLIDQTKAGSKCTACTLDLEFLYVSLTSSINFKPTGPSPIKSDLSLKRKVYSLIDSFSSLVNYTPSNFIPIIKGQSVSSFVIVSNFSLFNEGIVCAPSALIKVVVRDGLGSICHKKSYVLNKEEKLKVNVSNFLPAQENERFSVGSVEVLRNFSASGVRGTTRPQLEISSHGGNGMVHMQSDSLNKSGGFSCVYRPKEDRLYVAIINTGKAKITFLVECMQKNLGVSVKDKVVINPYETKLYPVSSDKLISDNWVDIKWSTNGRRSIYVLCSSIDDNLFSVDHAN